MSTLLLSSFADFKAFRLALIDAFGVETIQTDAGSLDMALLEWAFDHIEPGMDEPAARKAFLEWALLSVNCAGCHAPSGLIYNHDIAAKFADWWDEIDSALDQYHENIGERFAPETCGSLVWFAVEWRANDLGQLLESYLDNQDSEQ